MVIVCLKDFCVLLKASNTVNTPAGQETDFLNSFNRLNESDLFVQNPFTSGSSFTLISRFNHRDIRVGSRGHSHESARAK